MGGDWKEVSGLAIAERAGKAERLELGEAGSGEPWVVWLGHASFLIRWGGTSLVVDPVFKKWIGLTPRRVPLPDLSGLGKVDAVLLSHGHMDHLDEGSLRQVGGERILIPRKTEGFLSREMRGRCVCVEVGDEVAVEGLTVTVVEAKHGGWRYPWQRGYFACGFVVSDGERMVYVAGDTAYGPHFKEIGRRWKVDTALLPIGAYAPQWFLRKRHLNPEEACLAAGDLGAGEVVPFHFGSYRLSLESLDEPMRRFVAAAEGAGLVWRLPYAF